MRIIHLEASTGWGGQEMRILKEAEGMRLRGHEIVMGVMRGGMLVAKARAAGFQVYELNFRRSGWIRCFFQLLSIFRRHRIDIVNTHSSLDSWIGGIAARAAKRLILRTRHLSTPIKGGFVYRKLADYVVTTCEAVVPLIENRCCSIATGVDPEKIRFASHDAKAFRESLGVSESDFLVGTVCVMRSWKGIEDFLKAADRLRDVKWVIVGGGHAETYKRIAKEMKLDGVVHFAGHLDNPVAAIGALDAFALLSTAHEGVSQAILQAAFLEKPLVATATGGLCEVCIPGVTGLQVAPFAPDQVAEAVLKLKKDVTLRTTLGFRAKKLVEEKFTINKTLDRMEEVYRELCNNVRKRSSSQSLR